MPRTKSTRLTLSPVAMYGDVPIALGEPVVLRRDGDSLVVGRVRQRQNVADGYIYHADLDSQLGVTGELWVGEHQLAESVRLTPATTELAWLAWLASA